MAQTTESSTPEKKEKTLRDIILEAIRNSVIGIVVLGGILLLLAWKIDYWQAWVFTIVFVLATNSQGVYLFAMDPELLKRRTQVAPENESTAQRLFIIVGLVAGLSQMVVSALDQRFGWSQMPPAVSILGNVLIVVAYIIYYFVFRENSYAASSIQTFEGQKVISTGLYGRIRHPKYMGDLFLVIGVPLALGSWWGLAIVLLTCPALAWRILDEEKLLSKDLPGYDDYMRTVRYRLVPYLW